MLALMESAIKINPKIGTKYTPWIVKQWNQKDKISFEAPTIDSFLNIVKLSKDNALFTDVCQSVLDRATLQNNWTFILKLTASNLRAIQVSTEQMNKKYVSMLGAALAKLSHATHHTPSVTSQLNVILDDTEPIKKMIIALKKLSSKIPGIFCLVLNYR